MTATACALTIIFKRLCVKTSAATEALLFTFSESAFAVRLAAEGAARVFVLAHKLADHFAVIHVFFDTAIFVEVRVEHQRKRIAVFTVASRAAHAM
jgi:hypothetical protein